MSDYISREAALTALQNPELFNVSPRFLQILRDLPAADVEPVRYGKWNIRVSNERTLCLECSVCGRNVDNSDLHFLLELGEYGVACQLYPYCHCGAKMCLEDENDETIDG